MIWIKTSEQTPKLHEPVLTDRMITDRLTPAGWESGNIPQSWFPIYKPQRDEDQKSISEWGQYTFGVAKDPSVIVGRALEEFGELMTLFLSPETGRKFKDTITAVRARSGLQELDVGKIADELADVLVVLYQAAESFGIDLLGAVDAKMVVNRARKWKITDEGIGQHE